MLLVLFYSCVCVRHAENCFLAGLRAQEVVAPFLYYLLAVGKQEQDKRPRDKGPVIRDGVRPVPRLASRTITLRELESVQTGPDQESSEEEWRGGGGREEEERERERKLLSFPPSLSTSFFVLFSDLALICLILRTR